MPDVLGTVVRGHLQTASIMYQNQAFIAQEVAPGLVLPTSKSKVNVYNRGDMFRDDVILRAPGTVTPISDYKISTENVDTNQYARKSQITDEDLQAANLNSDLTPPIDWRQTAIELNSKKLDLKTELIVSAAVTAETWLDGNAGGEDAGGLWAAAVATNTFLTDIDTATNALREAGIPLNHMRLAMDFQTWQGVRKNSAIADRTQYTKDNYPSVQDMKNYLAIDGIFIGGGIYSTAQELAAGTDFTSANLWGGSNDKGYAILYYYPPKIGLREMSAAYLCYNKLAGGQKRKTFQNHDTKDTHSWIYESQQEIGYKSICTNAAYAWKDTHTT